MKVLHATSGCVVTVAADSWEVHVHHLHLHMSSCNGHIEGHVSASSAWGAAENQIYNRMRSQSVKP